MSALAETPTVVYTDGVSKGDPGPGGWCWVTVDGRSNSGGMAQTTNSRMELMAVLQAVRSVDGPLEIYLHSTYIVSCFKNRWYEGWMRKGWRNSENKLVPNQELWIQIVEQVELRNINFHWVEISRKWSEEANRIAMEAAGLQEVVEEQALF